MAEQEPNVFQRPPPPPPSFPPPPPPSPPFSSPTSTTTTVTPTLLRERGYPYLGRFWAKTKTGMVRTFSPLAVRNLVYLQAELCHLEHELGRARADDVASGEERRVDCDWDWALLAAGEAGDGGCGGEGDSGGYDGGNKDKGSRQWELVLKIREKLGEYHSALLQYQQIAALAQPTERQRAEASRILGSAALNPGFGRFQSLDLGGVDGPRAYARAHADDLVLLDAAANAEDDDALSRWVVRPLVRGFWRLRGSRGQAIPQDLENGGITGAYTDGDDEEVSGTYLYPGQQFARANRVAGALFSAAVPLASMVVLWQAGGDSDNNNSANMDAKVGLVCLFTLVFCLALSVLSKARRIEVFAATAAFASLQVVWISQNN